MKGMILNGFIELYLTTYLDFLVSACLTIMFGAIDLNFMPYGLYSGELLSLAIAILTIVVGLLFILIASVAIIFQKNYKKLNSK